MNDRDGIVTDEEIYAWERWDIIYLEEGPDPELLYPEAPKFEAEALLKEEVPSRTLLFNKVP